MTYGLTMPAASALLLASGLCTTAVAQDAAPDAKVATTICLAPVTVEATPAGMDPVAAVRDAFMNFLSGPSLGVQPLNARLQSQVREEAKLAGCRFLLLPSIKHERKTGGGLLGRVAGGAVQQGAWAVAGSAGSTAGRVVAGAAAGAASSAVSGYASGSQQSDELTISYRLESAEGRQLLKKSEKQKAKSAGEDLLTPVVQRASEAIANAVVK
jgi:hypothetical protein